MRAGPGKTALNFLVNRNLTLMFVAWHDYVTKSHAALKFWLNAAMGSAFRRWVGRCSLTLGFRS